MRTSSSRLGIAVLLWSTTGVAFDRTTRFALTYALRTAAPLARATHEKFVFDGKLLHHQRAKKIGRTKVRDPIALTLLIEKNRLNTSQTISFVGEGGPTIEATLVVTNREGAHTLTLAGKIPEPGKQPIYDAMAALHAALVALTQEQKKHHH